MSYVSNRVKVDTQFANSFWNDQSRHWESIDAISTNLLTFDIEKVTTNTKLLSPSIPTTTGIIAPTEVIQEITNPPITTMSEV